MNFKSQIAIVLIIICALSRCLPHIPNFSPHIGIALFGGAMLKDVKISILVPILSIIISDLIINNTIARNYFPDTQGLVLWAPYMTFSFFSMVVIVGIGHYFLSEPNVIKVLSFSIASSIIFFIISNFGVWVTGEVLYPKTMSGLVTCYVAGIPFYKATFTSAVLSSFMIFGAHYILTNFRNTKVITSS